MTDNSDYKWCGPSKGAEDMHPDLSWLARNVSEWGSTLNFSHIGVFWDGGKPKADYVPGMAIDPDGKFRQKGHKVTPVFSKPEWLQARKDLGLIMSDAEEEIPAPEWNGYVDADDDTISTSIKQLRYQDAKGEDWIDEFARTASVDEFRGAMRFTLGKYNRRAGKKDELVREIEKMRDYCDRWIEYERSL